MIGLVDCNNFYASCERLFQPHLRRRPLVVLSNNDGCVIARSEEAKALGIKMGTPAFKIEAFMQAHNVAVFSSNYTLYGDLSARVMATLGQFTPNLEVYSIDEAFLDFQKMTGVASLENYAAHIKKVVAQWVGIPVGIGVGATKSLAKAANKYAKKMRPAEGIFVMDSEEKRRAVLAWLPVEEVWGVGRRWGSWLHGQGIRTALDFSRASIPAIRRHMHVVGERLIYELNGTACLDLELLAPAKKSICTSRSFGSSVSEKEVLMEALATFTARGAEKLRRQKSCAGAIHIFIHTNAHRPGESQYHGGLSIPLLSPTASTPLLMGYTRQALDRLYRPGLRYKKGGVILSDVVPEGQVQQTLFGRPEGAAAGKKIMEVMDGINADLGPATVRLASMGTGTRWKLRREHLSSCYTTHPDQLLQVHI